MPFRSVCSTSCKGPIAAPLDWREVGVANQSSQSLSMSISFWANVDFDPIAGHETLKHLLESEPVIRTFDVQSSTTHKIAAGRAA